MPLKPGDLVGPRPGIIGNVHVYLKRDVSSSYVTDLAHGDVAFVVAVVRCRPATAGSASRMALVLTNAGIGWCFTSHLTVLFHK